MATAQDIIQTRIDHDTKVQASAALQAMGLSVSDAIRLMMTRIAEEKTLPFVAGIPNQATATAIDELERNRGETFQDVHALMADIDADD